MFGKKKDDTPSASGCVAPVHRVFEQVRAITKSKQTAWRKAHTCYVLAATSEQVDEAGASNAASCCSFLE